MKKKLIGLLASLACLACFAGCNNPLYSGDSNISGSNSGNSSNIETSSGNLENSGNSSSTDGEKTYDPQGAAGYIESMYKNKNKTGRVDYEVVKKVLYDGDLYTIAWSVNVDCVTVVEEDDKFIIDVDEATTVDTPFILTATLTAPDGSTAKVDLERILTAAPSKVPAQITGDPVEGTEYKLYVYQAANKKDLYINGKMKNTYYFDTTDSFEEGISIYVEKTQGGFYLYHNAVEAEGEAPVKTYINIVKSGTHTNAKYETTASSVFVYDETLGTMVVNLDGTKYYLGADGTFNTVEPQSKLEDGYYMGYLVSLVDASSVTAEDKVEQTLKELSIAPVYVGNNEIELAKQGIRFADTKISWTVEGAGAVLDGNKLSLTAQSAASEITLKATAKNGEVSDEAELKFKLVPNTAAEIVKAATSLKAGESFGNSVELTGIVTAIPTPYAEQYANVTVSMLVEGKTIDAYRLVGVGADVLAKGYTVTVMGVITNYNGTVQFGQGCEIVSFVEGDESDVPEAPTYTMAEIVDMAYELAPGAKLDGTQTLKGVITKINTPYDAGYGNITVTIVVEGKEDKPIECYRLKGDEAASLKVGDTITVSGTIKHYSYDGTSVGKIEFDAGCTIDAYEAGEGVVTPPSGDVDLPAADSTITIAQAITIGDALTRDSTTTNKYYISGTVAEITNTTYGNMFIESDDGRILVYGTYDATGANRFDAMSTKPVVGDTVKLYTVVGNFNGAQLKNAWILEINGVAVEGGEAPEDPDDGGDDSEAPSLVKVTEIAVNTAYDFAFVRNNEFYYFAGTLSDNTFYLQGTTDYAKSVKVYVKAAATEGEYYLYFLDGNTEKYIEMYSTIGTDGKEHVNPQLVDTPSVVYTYNAEYHTLVCTLGETDFFFGTRADRTYDTFSCSDVQYFSTNCVGNFYVEGEGGEVTPPETPDDGGNEGETPAVPSTPAEIVDAAWALAENTALDGNYTLTGVITEASFNSKYSDYNVTIVVEGKEDKPMYCYGVKGATEGQLAVGDTITVTGPIKNYNGTVEFYMPNLDEHVAGEGGEVTPPETPETPDDGGDVVEGEALTLDFGDVANRVSQDTASQIWAQNGVTVTNNKAKSTSNVADYSAPARFYKSSELIVECDNMVKIVFECATYQSKDYASDLVNSIADDANISVTKDGTTVTVVFASAVDSLTISSLAAQVRVNSISVYTA